MLPFLAWGRWGIIQANAKPTLCMNKDPGLPHNSSGYRGQMEEGLSVPE